VTLDPYAPMPRRRWPFVVAALVLVALIASGITYAITAGSDSTSSDDDPTGPIVQGLPIDQSCPDFSDAPEGIPTEAPEVDEWVTRGNTTYPRSADSGPARPGDEDSVDQCFARTPTGALFALLAQGGASGSPELVDDVLECCFVGPNVPNLRRVIESGEMAQSLEDSENSVRYLGFRFESATDNEVVIEVLQEITDASGETEVYGATGPALWVDGGWKTYAPLDQDLEVRTVTDPAAEGFTTW